MSYVKNTWTEGDIITAEKLNNIENGVSEVGGVYELNVTEEEWSQMISSSTDSPWQKDITEEEFIKIENSNKIKLISNNNQNSTFFNKQATYYYESGSTKEINIDFNTFVSEGSYSAIYLLKIHKFNNSVENNIIMGFLPTIISQ